MRNELVGKHVVAVLTQLTESLLTELTQLVGTSVCCTWLVTLGESTSNIAASRAAGRARGPTGRPRKRSRSGHGARSGTREGGKKHLPQTPEYAL